MTGLDLAPTVNALLPLGGVILAAAIGVIVAIRLKPVELLNENRALRTEIRTADDKVEALRREFETFRDKVDKERRVLGLGFDALYRFVERMRSHWGDGDMPSLDAIDQASVAAAQGLRNKGD